MNAPKPSPDAANPKGSNLVVRLATAGVLVPTILWLLYWAPPWGFLVFCTVGVVAASTELAGMTLPGHPLLRGWMVLATLGLFAMLVLHVPSPASTIAILAVVVGGFLAALLQPEPVDTAGPRMAWLVTGPLYIGALAATVAMLHQRSDGAGGWVVLAMMLAFFGDTFAYFAGRAFGRHKLYPKVSPKKTIEGAIGGLVGSITGALLAHYWYLPVLPLIDAIVLGLAAGALGQAGDLMESLIKRSSGVKDSGTLLPGHGGLLDRIDALLMTAAVVWTYAALRLPL